MDQLIPAIAALLAGLGAWAAAHARKEAKQANEAVNNVDRIAGQPRIYDMVFDLHMQGKELVTWKRSYDGGPLDSGEKVEAFVTRIDADLCELHKDLKALRENCPGCKNEPPPAA